MTVLGSIALWLTLLAGMWAVVIGIFAGRWNRGALAESSRRAAVTLAPLLAIVLLSLAAALVRRDLNVAYVSDHVTQNLTTPYAVAALLAGWQGSGALCLGAFTLLAIPTLSRRTASSPAVVATGLVTLVGVGILTLAGEPFRRLGVTPLDGRGLDPLLLGPVLFLERPLAILGSAALVMAVCFGATGRSGRPLVRWLEFAWVLFTASLAVGLWQAYRFAGPDGAFAWSRPRSVVTGAGLLVSLALLLFAATRGNLRARIKSPGSVLILAGLACLVMGGLGARRGAVRDIRVKAGASVSLPSAFGGSYTLTHMGVSRFQMTDRVTAAATLEAARDDQPVGLISSEKRQYFGLLGQPIEGPVSSVGIHRGMLEDVRVVFRESTAGEEALYHVRVVPLASLLWLGALLLVVGGVLAMLEPAE